MVISNRSCWFLYSNTLPVKGGSPTFSYTFLGRTRCGVSHRVGKTHLQWAEIRHTEVPFLCVREPILHQGGTNPAVQCCWAGHSRCQAARSQLWQPGWPVGLEDLVQNGTSTSSAWQGKLKVLLLQESWVNQQSWNGNIALTAWLWRRHIRKGAPAHLPLWYQGDHC